MPLTEPSVLTTLRRSGANLNMTVNFDDFVISTNNFKHTSGCWDKADFNLNGEPNLMTL